MQIVNFENSIEQRTQNKYIHESISLNTRLAYQADILHYQKWGGTLPSNTETVIAYLTHFADSLSPSTIRRRLKTIKTWHQFQQLPDPTDSIAIERIMRGIRRVHGRSPKKSPPLTMDHLETILDRLKGNPSFKHIRNLALIQIGFFGAFRRSELVNIQYEHLRFSSEGVEIFIPYSKADQLNRGNTCGIPYGNKKICPVLSLTRWLEASGIKDGAVFRRVAQNNRVYSHAICDMSVNKILKEVAAECNIPDAALFSGHSFRRGYATSASRKGANITSIMKQGRWKSHGVVLGYIDEGTRFTENSAWHLLNG